MRWLRSLVVATVLGAGLFFATSDSAEARPRYYGGYYGNGYRSNYSGYYGNGYRSNYGSYGGYNRGYYGYPRYSSNYGSNYYGYGGYYNNYYRPGWGFSTPGFYMYGR